MFLTVLLTNVKNLRHLKVQQWVDKNKSLRPQRQKNLGNLVRTQKFCYLPTVFLFDLALGNYRRQPKVYTL